ncbi:MAG: TonB-dependent receptor [Muribaculaceae bacterium]|nr:TonB-dependent receptor [Muribaculaceae bacterium]
MEERIKFRIWLWLAILLLMPQSLSAQSVVSVSGTVTDTDGEVLIGATVMVKGGKTGTVTDLDGYYKLDVPANAILEFSYVGYDTKQVRVESRSVIDVVLESSSESLDEVVVIGYGTTKKVTMTGAVSNISGKELLKSPAASIGNALSGKLPGVSTVQYSGRPGGDDPTIMIRGVGSFNGSDPLILVDGVERSFSQIDPNEVQDISILKDASATAVFGVRGANGVILITTKRGDIGKTDISVSASFGIQQVSEFLKNVDSYTWATLYNEAQRSDGTAEDMLRFSPEVIQHFKDGDQPLLYPNVNWIDYVMKKTAPQQQYNVSVKGGNKIARYFVSLGMLNQDGLFNTFSKDKNTNFSYNRYNYRGNVDLSLGSINELSINIGGRLEDRYEMAQGESEVFNGIICAAPFAGAGIDSEGRRIVANKEYVGEYDNDGLFSFYGRGYNRQSTNVLNFDLIYKLSLDALTPGLDFRIKGAYNSSYTQQKRRTLYEGVTYQPVLTPDGSVALSKKGDAWNLGYEESYWFARDWYAEASFNYSHKFGDHEVTALLLYNQSKYYYPGNYDDIPHGYVGLVGRATYNYKMRYLIDFNIGYNGSENFAKGYRYGTFPSVSLGWIASNEKFWESVANVIPYLKLRGSVGQVGNDNMNGRRFLYLLGSYYMSPEGGYNFGLGTWTGSAYEQTAGNPFVTWETATKQNYGIDIHLLGNSQLKGSVDIFFENRKDILIDNTSMLPGITAQKPSSVNMGRVKNHGYEVSLTWSDYVGNDFRYSITPSIAYARNKVIENGEVPPLYEHLSGIGYPVGQRRGYEFFEFYNPGKTEEHYRKVYGVEMPRQMVDVKAGDCVYADLTGDGVVDENDMHAMFYSDQPEYTFSLNASLSWKGLDFSMLWIGATNVTRDLSWPYRQMFGQNNRSGMLQWIADNSWTPATAETATLPRLSFMSKSNNTLPSSIYYVDASYIRLKNIEIGYSFTNVKFLPALQSLRIYFSGYNLLSFSKFKANDPESATSQITYPITRLFNLGVNLNF